MAETRETNLAQWDPFRELAPWGSFHELGRMGSLMGRLFEQTFGENAGVTRRVVAPAIDVIETDSHYVVSAELPGVRKEDIGLEVHDGVLNLRGEKRAGPGDQQQSRWLERWYGSFSRSLRLPADADPGAVQASFHDGVLRIEIAKREEAKPRSVAIR
jgi:HSP20 family protein